MRGTAIIMTCIDAMDLRPGDRLPGGDEIERVEHVRIGPEWVTAAWIRGADYDGTGLPSITWPEGSELQVQRKEDT